MAYGPFSVLLTRRFPRSSLNPKLSSSFSQLLTLAKPFSTSQDPNPKPSSLSARLSFVFDQIDAIEKERSQKHETLQRIRAWRQSKYPQQQQQPPQNDTHSPQPKLEAISVHEENPNSEDVSVATEEPKTEVKKEVELVHPWPEWIQLMERLVHQNYFDHMRRDEDKLVNDLGFDSPEFADDSALDFTKDFKSVHAACLNFGKDRFDILRSLSRQDIQAMVGFGCPNVDKKVVFSAKLLRKHVHLDEGDVCSSCSLRNNCERAYLLTNKEDEARTIDIMRILLTYGFDPVNGSVTNKSLLKQKSVKTVVRKLLHEVVKLSSVPINPNLPPPVIKKAPPKVKQPPPPPKKRVGRDDVEMKKGDWLCPKCDFMNFAKNTICLQCDAKRPKRQLLPGEWECPECNFLNYRRNMVCFQCECKRPPDEFMENKMQDTKLSSKPRFDKKVSREEVSNAWNFDFDDDESDGADVAAFEYADAQAIDEDFPSGNQAQHGNHRAWKGDFEKNNRVQGDGEYSNPGLHKPGVGFDDFEDEDEDDIDSYELETQAQNSSARVEASENHFSEFKGSLELDDIEDKDDKMHAHTRTASRSVRSRSIGKSTSFYGSEDDELDFDKEQRSIHSNFKSSHASTAGQKRKGRGPTKKLSFGSDSDEDVGAGLYSDEDDDSDEAYSSRRNKGNKHDPSRSNNGSRHDSGRRNFTENRKSGSFGGRKVNKFSDDFDGPSRQSYRNGRGSKGNDRNRKRFDDFDESDGSPQQSYRNGRGSKGSDRNRKRFDDFDEFDGSPQQSYRNGRGSRGNDHNRRRFDDFDRSTSSYGNGRVQSFGNGGGSRGNDSNRPRFEGRERGTGQFNKYSMGDRDSGEFRNSRRVIER